MRYKLICSVITDKTNGKWKIDMILISLQQVVSFYTTWSCWSSTSETGEYKNLYGIALDDCKCMSICPNLVFHTFIRIYLKLGV